MEGVNAGTGVAIVEVYDLGETSGSLLANISTRGFVQTGDNAGSTVMGGFSGLIICSANIPDKVAIAMDTQMDDGLIGTGTVRGQLQSAPNPTIAAAAAGTAYAETGTNTYALCRSL